MVVPRGRHGLPTDVVAEHQRERLLAATIHIVARRGYRGTTVDHIVKTAKVGYVAFYELFEGKQDCFLAAFGKIVAQTRERLVAAVPAEAPWPEQIVAGLRALVEAIAADPEGARVALVEIRTAGPTPYAHYEEAIDSAIPKLREGRALSPRAARHSEAFEEGIIGGVASIFHRRLVMGEADQIDGLLGEAVQSALAPYLGEAEARRIAAAAS